MASHTVALGSDLAARAAARGARERPWLQSKPVKGKLATICQTRGMHLHRSLLPSDDADSHIEENVGDSPGTRVKAAQSTSLPMLPISKSTEPIDRQSKFQRSPRNRVKAAEPVTAALGKPIGRCSPTSLTTTRRPEDGFKAASQSKIPVLSDSRMAAPSVRCSVAVTSRKSALKTAKGPSKTVSPHLTVASPTKHRLTAIGPLVRDSGVQVVRHP